MASKITGSELQLELAVKAVCGLAQTVPALTRSRKLSFAECVIESIWLEMWVEIFSEKKFHEIIEIFKARFLKLKSSAIAYNHTQIT